MKTNKIKYSHNEIINFKNLKYYQNIISKLLFKSKKIKKKYIHDNFNQKSNNYLINTSEIFLFLNKKINSKSINKNEILLIKSFQKKFEISQKIYNFYKKNIPLKKYKYNHPTNLILFGLLLIKLFEIKKNYIYLSTSLKIFDILSNNYAPNKILIYNEFVVYLKKIQKNLAF